MSNTEADAHNSDMADVEDFPPANEPVMTQAADADAVDAVGDEDYFSAREAFLQNEAEFLEKTATNSEAQPAKKSETTDPAAKAQEQEADEEADESQDFQGVPKRKHVNLARMGEDKANLVLFLDKNPDVPLDKAVEILGIQLSAKEQLEAQTAAAENSTPQLPSSLEEVESLIRTKRAERKQAFGEELDFKKAAELDEEIETLRDHAVSLQAKVQETQAKAAADYEAQWEEAKVKATQYYPDTTKAESPLVKRMLEIDRILEETGDPRFHAPNKPFLLAQAAAADLGIMPKAPGATKSPPPAPTVKTPPPPALQPVRGNLRTQTPAQKATLDDLVENIRSEDDYEAAKRLLRG